MLLFMHTRDTLQSHLFASNFIFMTRVKRSLDTVGTLGNSKAATSATNAACSANGGSNLTLSRQAWHPSIGGFARRFVVSVVSVIVPEAMMRHGRSESREIMRLRPVLGLIQGIHPAS